MPLDLTASDLPALWADARQFAAGVRLARPDALWLSLAPLVLAVVHWRSGRRARSALALLGRPAAVFALVTRPRRRGRLVAVAQLLAWTLLVTAAAGPRWGDGSADGVAVGRDVVIVLDLSRSMTADDAGGKQRWQAAAAGAIDLVDALRLRGGHRAAVVVFAARPTLLVPLTTDADHLTTALRDLDGDHPPPAVRPDPDAPSGTRIGAALQAAVAAHDGRFAGAQDIVLFSDGDDPADDREWAAGVTMARAAGVPVHVVGIGDPVRATLLMRDGKPVEFAAPDEPPTPVTTRLHEEVLTAIAAEGRGLYLPSRQAATPPAGDFFRAAINAGPVRELADDARPQPRDRAGWFFAAGLVLLLVSWGREP